MEEYKFQAGDFELAQNTDFSDTKFDTKPIGYFKDAMIRFRKSKAAVAGFIIIILIILYAIITPLVSGHSASESDSYFAYMQPYSPYTASLGIADGTYGKTLGLASYDMLNGIGIAKEDEQRYVTDPFDTGHADVAAGFESEYNPIRSKTRSVTRSGTVNYDAKVMSYFEVGFQSLQVTPSAYNAILEYEEESGKQILHPVIDSANQDSSIDSLYRSNVWYESNNVYPVDTSGNIIREIDETSVLTDNYLRNAKGKVMFYSRTGSGTSSYASSTVIGSFEEGETYTVNFKIDDKVTADSSGIATAEYSTEDGYSISSIALVGGDNVTASYEGTSISGLTPNSSYLVTYAVSVNAAAVDSTRLPVGLSANSGYEIVSILNSAGNNIGWSDTRMYQIRVFYWDYYTYYTGKQVNFILGTDDLGRDIATRLASGIGLSLILAFSTFIVNFVIGAIYGAIEGYYGGVADLIMERISDILANIPFVVLASIVNIKFITTGQMSAFGALIFAFCLTGWLGPAYRVRTQFYRFKNNEYVLAARTLGASDARIMWKHIFPNSLGTIITASVLTIPGTIFSESSLSYLSIINLNSGNMTSLGTMLATGQAYLTTYPHMIISPCVIIALLMISFNLFGNGLRDAFNPSLRGVEE